MNCLNLEIIINLFFVHREVHITRLICKNSIEEQMLTLANRKLELEKDVTARNDDSHGEG